MEQFFVLTSGELQIPCSVTEPDYGEICRVVLGVHGFGGSMADEIQAGIAEEMALFRAATLRFDFPAHGVSPLDSRWVALENCGNVLLEAAR